MEALLAMALLASLGALAWLVARGRARTRDLERLTRLLDGHEAAPAARSRLGSGDAAVRALARAVDRELDAQRGRDLARAAADERFREQLAALSHDLRTPLAGAQGYLQLARRAGDDAARREHCLGGAQERLAAVRVLVDDLFDYARAADPSWVPELVPCDLTEAAADALAVRFEALAARGWEPHVSLAEAAPVLAAPDALSRVVANLLDNALAHGDGAPSVCVEGTALMVENPVAPAAAAKLDAARLTERFYQGDPARSERGSGLGLAVARALAESMGGTLTVGLATGAAPCFRARLELRPAP